MKFKVRYVGYEISELFQLMRFSVASSLDLAGVWLQTH